MTRVIHAPNTAPPQTHCALGRAAYAWLIHPLSSPVVVVHVCRSHEGKLHGDSDRSVQRQSKATLLRDDADVSAYLRAKRKYDEVSASQWPGTNTSAGNVVNYFSHFLAQARCDYDGGVGGCAADDDGGAVCVVMMAVLQLYVVVMMMMMWW